MNKQIRRFSFLWLLLIMLMPVSVTAKTYKGTINIKVGETYYVTHGYNSSSAYTVSGYWERTDGTAFRITSSSSGNGGCTIVGHQVGTSTLNWTGVVAAGWSVWDEEYYWTVNVTAAPVNVTKIELNKSQLTLALNNKEQLTATVSPYNATDKSVTWSSNSESVATVNSAGKVTAKTVGNATITCKASDGSGVKATCVVTVTDAEVYPLDITMKNSLSMKPTDTYKLHCAYAYPGGFSTSQWVSPTATWTCSDTSVATVSSDGTFDGNFFDGTVTAKAVGTAVITIKSANDVYRNCNVTVVNPTPLAGNIKQVSAGCYHTMILMTDGSLWACGNNKNGQLGDGTTTDCCAPKQVMTDVAAVSAGEFHTLILKTDGSLWACGRNNKGQLGDGNTTSINTSNIPKQIMTGVAAVSAGWQHTMILKTDGTLWACGDNSLGQLGDETNTNTSTPKPIMSGVAFVATGEAHTMAIKTDGSLWAWGYNRFGQLSDGTNTNTSKPKQIMTDVAAVSAGQVHTMVIKTDGTLWGCGYNIHGELGDGKTISVSTPKQIMTDVAAVSAGNNHTMIIKTDGTLWTCGSNAYGQLGDGTTTNSSKPKQIMTGVSAVSAGYDYTKILKTNGSLWACGHNSSGELGDCTNIDRYKPVLIAGTDIKVTSITLNKTTLSLEKGQSETLEAMVLPDDATDKTVTWSSSNANIVAVDNNGKVTAVAAGSATITCTANDGSGVKTTCAVTVTNPKPDKIVLPTEATVTAGLTIMLTPEVTPANAEYTLTWTSDDATIATVNANGVVTGIKKGQTFINVETDNGKTAYCKLTVTEPEKKVTSITLNMTTLSLVKGESRNLYQTVKPDDATDKTVTWSSNNKNVATVDASGKVVAVSVGNAAITCTSNDGSGVSATCMVTVKSVPEVITLPSTATVVFGQTITLTPEITPADAVTTLTWTSDDATIATVNANGVVTGIKKGQTFINVETDNGKTAYCKLTVTASEPTAITLPKNATVYVGEELTLTPTLTPEGSETTLTWKSDDELVVRVSAGGVLTGVAEGLAVVTVSTSNSLTANVKVKVEPNPTGVTDIQAGDNGTAPVYTLSGQRLAKPRKGLNIVGGKKVIVK